MPEPFRSSDIPEAQLPASLTTEGVGVYGAESHRLGGRDRLVNAAESVGYAVGRTVGAVESAVRTTRSLPRRAQEAGRRLIVIPGRGRRAAQETSAEWKQKAERGVDEVKEFAGQAAYEARRRAGQTLEQTRDRVASAGQQLRQRGQEWRRQGLRLADERPLQVILGAAAAAALLGFALRIGRSSHA